MSRLIQNSTRAELSIGASFAETFESSSAVIANGGSITGSPSIDFGVELDGLTQKISYDLFFGTSSEISFQCKFIPNFNYDATNTYFILDSENREYAIYKLSTAGGNGLIVFAGGGVIANISPATYGPHWKVGQENLITVSLTSGAIRVMLNKVLVGSNANTYTPPVINEAVLHIGSSNTDTSKFDGSILDVKVFNALISLQEHIDYYNNDTYTYMNDAVVNLPMLSSTHDPSNTQTLDVSGNKNHAIFGNGYTSTTFPTKLSKRGYSFDGSSDYLNCGTGIMNNTSCTLVALVKIDDATADQGIIHNGSSLAASQQGIRLISGNIRYLNSINTSTSYPCTVGNYITIIATADYDGANTTAILFVNGEEVSREIEVGSMDISISQMNIGWVNTTRFFNGNIYTAKYFNKALTPIQVADLHHRMISEVNYNG